jgi:hypothetical protein
MPTPTRVSRGQLLDFAADVAWRFKAYCAYGENESTAIRAIRKKCPGFTSRQYENSFAKALELYDAANRLVADRSAEFWKEHRSGNEKWPHLLDDDLRKLFPGFRVSTIRSLVGMTFYYWHMR